jgi:MFS family permease
MTLVAGRFADQAKQPKLIIGLGYALTAFGFFLLIFVHSIWQLLAVQLLIGLASPLYAPAFNALYTRHLNKDHEGFEWSLWDATDYFTTAVGGITGGAIATYFGFDGLFTVMALIALGAAAFILFLPARFFDLKSNSHRYEKPEK